MIYSPYEAQSDAPIKGRPLAQYYGNAPVGPNGEHTLTLSFRSADERVFTHDFYMTAVEELQLGAGEDAAVYRVDSVSGTLTLDPELVPYSDLPDRAEHAALFQAFAE